MFRPKVLHDWYVHCGWRSGTAVVMICINYRRLPFLSLSAMGLYISRCMDALLWHGFGVSIKGVLYFTSGHANVNVRIGGDSNAT
jgi:hypothetical protein